MVSRKVDLGVWLIIMFNNDHSSLQWSRLIVSKTVWLFIYAVCIFRFFVCHPVCNFELSSVCVWLTVVHSCTNPCSVACSYNTAYMCVYNACEGLMQCSGFLCCFGLYIVVLCVNGSPIVRHLLKLFSSPIPNYHVSDINEIMHYTMHRPTSL